MTTLHRAIERIQRAKRIAITTHIRPDGDAVGSALGLCRLLNETA
jgi:nanoRNase/pAp phosphatase (c-di-AMP/oligoRNAs hydrolase)